MTPDQVLLTTAEVAERCRVGQATVRRWVRDGWLEAVALPSGTLRFRVEDVDKIFAGPERPAADPSAMTA